MKREDSEGLRRHAESDLAAIRKRLDSGKTRGVREKHLLATIANRLTSILDNLDSMEERRKIGFDTGSRPVPIHDGTEMHSKQHGAKMTAVNGYDDDDDINSEMTAARAIYDTFNKDVENCAPPGGPGTDARHPAGVGPVRGIRR